MLTVPMGRPVDRHQCCGKILLVVALGMIGLEIDRDILSQVSWRSVALGVGLWALVAPIALALVLWT